MKKIITAIFLLLSLFSKAQVYNGSTGNILDNGQNTYFNLTVSGLIPSQMDSTFGIEKVYVKINHPEIEQLSVYLQSPSGRIVRLTVGNSVDGANYDSTCFDSRATTSITLGTAPYTGTFKPIGYLGRFNNGQSANGVWKLIVHDYQAFDDAGTLISWGIKFGDFASPPVVFTSSNLPIVSINTNNQTLSTSKILINMGIIYNGVGQRNQITDLSNNYNGTTEIHIRGNTSSHFEKKSFSLETHDIAGNPVAVSLLGMPPESDWVLIASYADKTLMRNSLTFHLFEQMGHYATRFRYVEVVINNEYQGVYALMEKPKRDSYRINVEKLNPTENTLPDISGGYIFQINRSDEPGWNSLLPGNSTANSHFFYQYVYPNDTAITTQQKDYIKSVVDSFETAMNSSYFEDLLNGYNKYIDVESFIDFFIINELSKNVDAYRLSTFLYKDGGSQGGKIHIGPVWDYDLAWHNCNYGNSFDHHYWQYSQMINDDPIPTWWKRFMEDDNFKNKLYCRWQYLRQNILSTANMDSYIDSSATILNESQQRNFTQWPTLGAYIHPNPQSQTNADYQTEVNDLKNWIAKRTAWMDGIMPANCTAGIQENIDANYLSVYPNPFSSTTTFSLNLNESADVSLRIVDILGKEVAMLSNGNTPSGESNIIFDRKEMVAGIYFYQMKINNTIKTGKMIIQ